MEKRILGFRRLKGEFCSVFLVMAFEMTPAELECIGMICSFFQNFLKNSYKTKNPKAKSIEAIICLY